MWISLLRAWIGITFSLAVASGVIEVDAKGQFVRVISTSNIYVYDHFETPGIHVFDDELYVCRSMTFAMANSWVVKIILAYMPNSLFIRLSTCP